MVKILPKEVGCRCAFKADVSDVGQSRLARTPPLQSDGHSIFPLHALVSPFAGSDFLSLSLFQHVPFLRP
jgi:hypothetical protein